MARIAYIMGHSFSGSTLLTFLLGSHPQIATVGELGITSSGDITAEEYFCSCQSPIRRCGFWQHVSREMAERGHPFDIWEADLDFRAPGGGLADAVLRMFQQGPLLETGRGVAIRALPRARRELSRILGRIQALAEIVTSIQGGDTFLDSSKRPERAMLMRRFGTFGDMRILHLVRDPRAVSWSTMKNVGVDLQEAIRSWLADNHSCEHARRFFPADRWLTLRYEDLCAEPLRTLQKVYSFLGVPARDGIPDFRAVEHHIIGNRMRLASTAEIRLDESWKQALTPEQVAAIDRRVAPLSLRYGYAPV